MSGDIKHLIYHDSEGDVRLIRPAKGVNPADGSIDGNGWTMKYYYYELPNPGEWMDTHAWNGSTWVSRVARPNKVAVWSGGQWTWDAEAFKDIIRKQRTNLLYQSDWALVEDSPLTDSEKTEVRTYRSALRNITTTDMPASGLVSDVAWPTKPTCLG